MLRGVHRVVALAAALSLGLLAGAVPTAMFTTATPKQASAITVPGDPFECPFC